MRVYADYAAAAPLRPVAYAAMTRSLDTLAAHGGNASSAHRAGAAMRAILEEARARIAGAIGAAPLDVVLTSGATEANNLALRGVASSPGARLAVAASDHASVLAPTQALARAGVEALLLRVDGDGRVDPGAVRAARPTLLSVSAVNAETGVVQDLPALVAAARAGGALVHLDAAQAAGAMALDVGALDIDLMTLSAHKVGGPPGAGALYIRRGLVLDPVQRGGSQERGLRAGTENVPAAAGFAAALDATVAARPHEAPRLRALTRRFREEVAARWPAARLVGAPAVPAAPHIVDVALPGHQAEALVTALDLEGIAASAGSACAAGGTEPSHVLQAMGWSAAEAASALRFSFGWASSEADVAVTLDGLAAVLARTREAAWPARAS